ncbi:MAG: hypothetical protein JNL83_12465 [Myxococcales bacterium]|nr:hypothetical protein [Myxococcales bacterium]
MSDRTKIAAIFGAAAVLLGGGLYYFFRVYQPQQERGKAAAEIEAWERRLLAAQTCVLGDRPASARAGEALAVRELSPEPWDRSGCLKLVGKLSRGIAEDTGMMNVEHAWMTVDRAAGKVATAFATHVPPDDESPSARSSSALADALDELATARAELRATAGMDPPPPLAASALPPLAIIPVTDGSDRVVDLVDWPLPSAGGTIGYGTVKGKAEVQLTLVPGATPRAQKLPPGALRAVPDGTWGAAGLSKDVAIGRIDDRGAFADMTHLPVELGAKIVIAAGTFESGIVVYAASNRLVIARSSGGAFTAEQPHEVGRITFAIDPRGTALVAWSSLEVEGTLHALVARDGRPVAVRDLGPGVYANASCLTRSGAWIRAREHFVRLAEAATPHDLPEHELLGCSAEAALLHRFGTAHYAVCGESCRSADLAAMRPSPVATIAGDKVVAITARDRVLAVYTEGKPPAFYALDKPFRPTFAHSDGKVVDVVGTDSDGVAIARVTP